MRLLQAFLALCVLIVFANPVQARHAPLVDPAPVAIPAGLAPDKVVADIKRALIGRGWEITNEAPGRIDSTLHLREHMAKITVTYDAQQVRFAYVDSANLDFEQKKGQRYIHPNFNGWMGYLVSDLTTNLQVSSSSSL